MAFFSSLSIFKVANSSICILSSVLGFFRMISVNFFFFLWMSNIFPFVSFIIFLLIFGHFEYCSIILEIKFFLMHQGLLLLLDEGWSPSFVYWFFHIVFADCISCHVWSLKSAFCYLYGQPLTLYFLKYLDTGRGKFLNLVIMFLWLPSVMQAKQPDRLTQWPGLCVGPPVNCHVDQNTDF